MDPILPTAIERYLHDLQREPDPVLAQMERMGDERGFPIIGPVVGRFCAVQAQAIGARTVFEMGSGFGYSTFHFARAVGTGGKVVHTDGDARKSAEAKEWLTKGRLAERVRFEVGIAQDILRREKGPFDVVFIDVDKEQYPEAWTVARTKVRVGGLILTDNTLWSGKVADAKARDAATEGVRKYNEAAFSDPSFVTSIVPLRDGLAVSLRVR